MICPYCKKRGLKENRPTCGNIFCRAKRKLLMDRTNRKKNYRRKKDVGIEHALLV